MCITYKRRVTGNRFKKSFNFTASIFSVKSRNTLHYPGLHTYFYELNKQDQEITFINKINDNHFMSVQPSRTDVYAFIFTKYVGHTNYCLMMTTPPTFSN